MSPCHGSSYGSYASIACWPCMTMYTVPSYSEGFLYTCSGVTEHSQYCLIIPSLRYCNILGPPQSLQAQLPVGHIKKEGASLPGQLGPQKRVKIVDEHIFVRGAHAAELGQKFWVQIGALHPALALPIQHTRLRRGIIEFSHDIRSLLSQKRVNNVKITW